MDLRFHRVCQVVEQGLAFEAELVEHSVIDFRAHHPSRSKRNHFQVLSIPPLCLTRGIESVSPSDTTVSNEICRPDSGWMEIEVQDKT